MGRRTKADREQLAAKRIESVLRAHGVATARTLEQKISDAGPGDQRIDPHVLTGVRMDLEAENKVTEKRVSGIPWYYWSTTPDVVVQRRLEELEPIHARTRDRGFLLRAGQTLEIAVYRALRALREARPEVEFLGGFVDLNEHDDSTLYRKVEPEMVSDERVGGGLADFIVTTPDGGRGAIECKNTRQWIYPDRDEIRQLVRTAVRLDAVPILIARRIPYVTIRVLHGCGVVFHETYTQLYPAADADLATQARDKRLLGYHDIRVGNRPDGRLSRFITGQLPRLMRDAREKFRANRDLLEGYAGGEPYKAVAAQVLLRGRGASDGMDPCAGKGTLMLGGNGRKRGRNL